MAPGTTTSLTGVWDGRYAYPRLLDPVPFQAVLLEFGAALTGSIWETCEAGPERGRRLDASVEGRRTGRLVEFVKRYDGSGGRTHEIAYTGELSADATEIEGVWTIPGSWSGWFLMIRSPGGEAAVERKATERAG
jgi:hypothetical protein